MNIREKCPLVTVDGRHRTGKTTLILWLLSLPALRCRDLLYVGYSTDSARTHAQEASNNHSDLLQALGVRNVFAFDVDGLCDEMEDKPFLRRTIVLLSAHFHGWEEDYICRLVENRTQTGTSFLWALDNRNMESADLPTPAQNLPFFVHRYHQHHQLVTDDRAFRANHFICRPYEEPELSSAVEWPHPAAAIELFLWMR